MRGLEYDTRQEPFPVSFLFFFFFSSFIFPLIICPIVPLLVYTEG